MAIRKLLFRFEDKTFLFPGLFSTIICAATLALLPPSAAGTTPEPHPSLVKIDASLCMGCHEDLLQNVQVTHAPVSDDCTACHEFSKTEEGTLVTLADEEPALCIGCHGQYEDAVAAEINNPHPPIMDSCLTCHNPHATNEPSLLVGSLEEVCSFCHDPEDLNTVHDGKLQEAANCITCHAPHGSDNSHMLVFDKLHVPFEEGSCSACHRTPFGKRIRLRSRGERICTSCHGEFERPADGSLHPALKGERGRAGCLGCHDPHGSDSSSLLSDTAPGLCSSCHDEVVQAALAESGHAVAAEDCMTCHLPHLSDEPHLLTSPLAELCTMCHDPEDEELSGAHLGADMAALDCLDCHTPHGSGHQKLLATTVHPPVLDDCSICHEGGHDELAEDGGQALCLMCHVDIEEIVEQAKVPHPAMEVAECTECHNPHASAQKSLVKRPAGGVCTECHDDQAPAEGEVLHGVIEIIGCVACHEPHGSDAARLLRAEGADLCLSCHDQSRIDIPDDGSPALLLDRFPIPAETALEIAALNLSEDNQVGHPLESHRVSGVPTEKELKKTDTTFEGELNCLTCHNPHKGRSKRLFRWNAGSVTQACLQCHPK